jgi:hypothetical protein
LIFSTVKNNPSQNSFAKVIPGKNTILLFCIEMWIRVTELLSALPYFSACQSSKNVDSYSPSYKDMPLNLEKHATRFSLNS